MPHTSLYKKILDEAAQQRAATRGLRHGADRHGVDRPGASARLASRACDPVSNNALDAALRAHVSAPPPRPADFIARPAPDDA